MKYFLIHASGKQFCLKPGEWQDIDFVPGSKGDFLIFNRILLARQSENVQVGQPFLEDAVIVAKILKQVKRKKLLVLKTKPKKKYTRTKGHRKFVTRIEIQDIK